MGVLTKVTFLKWANLAFRDKAKRPDRFKG